MTTDDAPSSGGVAQLPGRPDGVMTGRLVTVKHGSDFAVFMVRDDSNSFLRADDLAFPDLVEAAREGATLWRLQFTVLFEQGIAGLEMLGDVEPDLLAAIEADIERNRVVGYAGSTPLTADDLPKPGDPVFGTGEDCR